MNKQRAIRSQADDLQDEYNANTATEFFGEDLTRQEHKDEADVNFIIRRYNAIQSRPLEYGQRDYDLNLQTAIQAVKDAQSVYDRLPPEVREFYPNWQSFMAAADSGELAETLDTLAENAKPATVSTQPTQEVTNATTPPTSN